MKAGVAACIAIALFTARSLAQTAGECTCREAEPTEVCRTVSVVERSQTSAFCESSETQCRGCVCDEAGDKVCDLKLQESFGFLRPGEAECGAVEVVQVVCTDRTVQEDQNASNDDTGTGSTGTTRRETLETSCDVGGVVPAGFPCVFACFPASLGELVGVEVDYFTNFTGALGATNNGELDATDISLNSFVTSDISYIIPSAPSAVVYLTESPLDFIPSPGVNVELLTPGQTVSVNNYGELRGTLVPTSFREWFLCSSDNSGGDDPEAQAALLVDAEATALSSGSVSASSSGDYRMSLVVSYTYDTTS